MKLSFFLVLSLSPLMLWLSWHLVQHLIILLDRFAYFGVKWWLHLVLPKYILWLNSAYFFYVWSPYTHSVFFLFRYSHNIFHQLWVLLLMVFYLLKTMLQISKMFYFRTAMILLVSQGMSIDLLKTVILCNALLLIHLPFLALFCNSICISISVRHWLVQSNSHKTTASSSILWTYNSEYS